MLCACSEHVRAEAQQPTSKSRFGIVYRDWLRRHFVTVYDRRVLSADFGFSPRCVGSLIMHKQIQFFTCFEPLKEIDSNFVIL